MRLRKYHGLGNDYLVLETAAPLDEARVRALCDRHRGLGADGVLEPLPIRRGEDGRFATNYAVRIWNPDGSRAEKSGNGLRILARWLRDQRAAPPEFSVEIRTFEQAVGRVRCRVEGAAGQGEVEVEMGQARFEPESVPCTRALLDSPVEVMGVTLRLSAVGLGNPHCVVLLDSLETLDNAPWRAWGAALEVHPLFPNRTNVQFVALDGMVPHARIWERGAGETSASGSSACAIAAVCRRLGRVGEQVVVQMPGGALQVSVDAELSLRLRGPVEEVGSFEPSALLLAKTSSGR